jgi:Rps23 Pro-64 3,4-dihydroxylase Tpa1-like proline 4-hydroxylase
MTKEELKEKLRTKGYCHFHISEFDEKYEDALKKHMIGIDDSKYKKLMTGVRLDVTNRELINDMVISDMYDETGNSKMYKAGTFENSEKIKNYIRNSFPKEDIFQIWHWNGADMGMDVETYYKPYFDKIARYFYDVEPSQQLKYNSQFTMYSNGCYLQNHKDGKVDGRLCVVLIYLNEEYDESNGGILILNGNEKVLPKIGNIAILDLGEFDIEHEVTEVVGNQNRYCVLSFISLKNEE